MHVSTETGWRGGEQQVQLLTDGLVSRGHKCYVAAPPGSPLLANRSAKGMGVPQSGAGEFDIFAAHRLAGAVKRLDADLIHAHTSHAHSMAWMASHFSRVPVIVSRRVDFPVSRNFLSRLKYRSANTHYIAISETVKRVLMEGGIEPERIAVVYSGIDPARFARRMADRDESAARQYGAEPGEALIANIAALTDHKDQATLLRAAAVLRRSYPSFRLVIAGSGELEHQLKAMCADLGLNDRVLFAGHLKDLSMLYAAADLFVMSSHLEGLCTSILDSMAVGVPVVATRAGGIPEIIEDGVNGLLAPVRDHEALAEKMRQALHEPGLAQRLVEQAHATVERRFVAGRMVEGTEAVYRKVLGT